MDTTTKTKFLPKGQAAEQLALVQAGAGFGQYGPLRSMFAAMTVAEQRRHAATWLDHYTGGRPSFITSEADAERVATVAYGYQA